MPLTAVAEQNSTKRRYNWSSGLLGGVIGGAAGVGMGLLIHASEDGGDSSPAELLGFGALGIIVGFFVGLALGNP